MIKLASNEQTEATNWRTVRSTRRGSGGGGKEYSITCKYQFRSRKISAQVKNKYLFRSRTNKTATFYVAGNVRPRGLGLG